MADNDQTQQQQPHPVAPPPTQPRPAGVSAQADATSQALADAAAKAERDHLDEVEEGGHYVVNGQHVNAYGKPVKKSAKGKWELVNEDDRREIGS